MIGLSLLRLAMKSWLQTSISNASLLQFSPRVQLSLSQPCFPMLLTIWNSGDHFIAARIYPTQLQRRTIGHGRHQIIRPCKRCGTTKSLTFSLQATMSTMLYLQPTWSTWFCSTHLVSALNGAAAQYLATRHATKLGALKLEWLVTRYVTQV